jgi:hypothetical protein
VYSCDHWLFAVGAELNRPRETRVKIGGHTGPADAQFLLLCAHAEAPDSDQIRAICHTITDWDALADAAQFHGLTVLLYRILDALCPGVMPEKIATSLRECSHELVRRNLILTSQMLALQSAFEGEGIPVLPLKGPVLAELLYPDPALRPFSDLDFLVHKRDVPAAASVLTRNGYSVGAHLRRFPLQTQMDLDFQLLFHHDRMGHVDLQWETAPSDYPFRFDTEALWQSLDRIKIAGREIPSLSRETLLLFLCIHGTKHMWSRLQWLGDVARLSQSPLNWSVVCALAEESKCERPLLLGLLLAYDLLDALVPEDILRRARAMQTVQLAANQLTIRLTSMPPVEPQGIELTAFNAGMAEHAWDRLRHYAALLKAPTDKELQILQLSRPLFFLYYPLRIGRLALQYTKRLLRS